tara:strand:+ start:1218 stop:1466 length:249 start_codon:yes stop_codon:yes gene_type:complete
MIDKKISIGSLLTIGTLLVGAAISYGTNSNQIINIEENHNKTVKRVKINEDSIVDLKIGVAKIETKLDDRFNRLEELLMDLE